jgi:hypothetical protein
MISLGALLRPRDQCACRIGAEPLRFRPDADSAKVEPIRIPAGEERGVAHSVAIGVESAGLVEQVEAGIVEMDQRSAQRPRQVATTLAMIGIDLLVHATRIVKKREEPYDVGVTTVG